MTECEQIVYDNMPKGEWTTVRKMFDKNLRRPYGVSKSQPISYNYIRTCMTRLAHRGRVEVQPNESGRMMFYEYMRKGTAR